MSDPEIDSTTPSATPSSAKVTTATPPAAGRALPANPQANQAMVAGLLSIIPGVGLVAIVLGLLAGQKARVNGGQGRGRAFIGVTFGIASLMLWAMLTGAFFQIRAMNKAKPAIAATRQFIMLVGSGNINAAKGLCTDAIDVGRLSDTAEAFNGLGGFVGEIEPYAGKPLGDGVQVDYKLPFGSGNQIFSTDWVFVNDQPRLADYRMTAEPVRPSTTRPAK